MSIVQKKSNGMLELPFNYCFSLRHFSSIVALSGWIELRRVPVFQNPIQTGACDEHSDRCQKICGDVQPG
jgi:hypothetical protein